MIERKICRKLMEWKRSPDKKALCIIGARQIGKTTVIRDFGQKNYDVFIEINFITDNDACKIFEGAWDADTIIANITAYKRQSAEVGRTLIFFDEIQECPNVRSAIKFLVEDGRFDYIESGSLLGVKYKEVKSYPVGFEEIYPMYPLDFEEFITANGVTADTIQILKQAYLSGSPLSDSMHSTFIKLFDAYLVVGGMPAVAQIYIDTHDIGKVVKTQQDILELYRLDIARYAVGRDKIKIRSIFDSIPAQLNSRKRRFYLSKVDDKGRQNRYENSFLWLSDAGVALPCYNVNEPVPPLQLNEKHNIFKLYMNDTGLLCAACMENIQFDILNGNVDINMGSILENAFAQALKCNGFSLNYFDSKKYGELDFVVQNGTRIDILEIKSGNDYRKHHALDKTSPVENWSFHKKIVSCKGNVSINNDIWYLPFYMIMFYKREEIPENSIYEVDLSGLQG